MTTVYRAREPNSEFHMAQRVKVSVGGKPIHPAAIAREMQNHESSSPIEAWQAAARALVVRQLLLDEAHRLRLVADPHQEEGRRETEEEALVRAVAEMQIVTPEPDEAACRRYYNRNRARFRSADLFEVSHILLPAAPGDKAARASAHEKAIWLSKMLAQEPKRFAAVAAEHSACPSGKSGGSLGQIKSGDTVPEFETALRSMTPGGLAREPVESRYGFHVVVLERVVAGRELPYELVAERIATYLHERSSRMATAQYLAILAANAGVEGVALPSPGDVGSSHRSGRQES